MSISRSSLLLGALLLGAASTGCGGDRVAPDAGALDAALDGPSDGAAPSDAAPSDATPSDAASPSCEDGTRNGFETDVDCGGSCPAGCPAGAGCARNGDCEGGLCEGRICAPASCEDGARNGDETDVDCGGSCPLGCGLGQGCAVMADCAAGTCLMEVCQPPGCMDGLVNGAETDLDCGGPECSPCGDGEACRVDGDCRSGRCAGDSCVLESCLNGVLEAAEVGIDCGGPCPACPAGTPCAADLECASGACVAGVCEGGAVSCLALRLADPLLGSGIYELQPDPAAPPRAVYCDMTTDGGGWTLVASTRGGTLNDERADWYADLGRATPSDAHLGIWDGLRPVIRDVSDIRFTCDVTVGVHEVDLSFYETGWYREITTGTDAESCFSESNGAGADVPPPERRNNRSAELLPLGDPWNAGYLEGEDSCSDEGDFTVDFDDRGMDSNQSDGTDWGEDDGSSKCGSSGSGQIWQIWVREALCSNGTLDGDETDLDCGGSCRPCADGLGCGLDADCVSARCEAGSCTSCEDGARNGDETDLDCGGSCAPCADGLGCGLDADCLSSRCETGSCTSCEDGLLSWDEVGVDCGGSCFGCPGGTPCGADIDCASGLCDLGACAAPAQSCRALLLRTPGLPDGAYALQPDPLGPITSAYCDMTTDGGGWTLVASTRTTPLDDARSDWHEELRTLSPARAHPGVWDGLRAVITGSSDIRFSCRADALDPAMSVDLAFYDIHWYREITTGFDGDSCFNEADGLGADVPAPARADLLAGVSLPAGDAWGAGYLEGEDACGDSGDFTVDLDDRGMDGDENDGTDWGEDDSSPKCGVRAIPDGAWFIWVREP